MRNYLNKRYTIPSNQAIVWWICCCLFGISLHNIFSTRTLFRTSVDQNEPASFSTQTLHVSTKQLKTQTAENESPAESYRSIPKHLRIMFAGDSVTRYQYLSLVYYLRYGVYWAEDIHQQYPRMPSKKPLMNGKALLSWSQFYKETTELLFPYEYCDCFRPPMSDLDFYQKTHETRYYYDPIHDNYVYYMQKLGPATFKGHWEPKTLALDVSTTTNKDNNNRSADHVNRHMGPTDQFVPPTWEYTWSNLGDYIVSLNTPKPTHIVLNGGMWASDTEIRDYNAQDKLIQSLRQPDLNNVTIVYKTTTKTKSSSSSSKSSISRGKIEQYEQRICSMADHCFDTSWTANVPNRYYYDIIHFHEPVYQWMNQDLLTLIAITTNTTESRPSGTGTNKFQYPHTWTFLQNQKRIECRHTSSNVSLSNVNNTATTKTRAKSKTIYDFTPCYWFTHEQDDS